MQFGKKIKLTISALALCLAAMPGTHAQMRMTMEDAIATARSQSVEALEARHSFPHIGRGGHSGPAGCRR